VSDKLIRREGEIVPVDDFAKRVDEELRKRGEEPAQEMLGKSTAFQQALANKIAQRALIVQRVPLSKARQWQLPFGPEKIAPGARLSITQQPQCMFRGEKIIVTGETDGLFIENIFVGPQAQMPTAGSGISALFFTSESLDNDIVMDTAQPALSITMAVGNRSQKERTFAAVLFGKAIL